MDKNKISYSYQTGIQIGWNWDKSKSYSHDSFIGFNYVHDIGLGQTSDLGGIYTVGENLHTTIANNIIHDVVFLDGSFWPLVAERMQK